MVFPLEHFTISLEKVANENLGLCIHTIVVVTIRIIFHLSSQIIRTVSTTMVKSFGENILWKLVQWKKSHDNTKL